jgi:hypothetical protein
VFLLQGRKALIGLTVGTMQFNKGAGKGRGIGCGQPQVCQGGRIIGKDRIAKRLGQITDQPLCIA